MSAVCCIKGCDEEVLCLGLCLNHWRMTVKHGSPVAQRPLSAINRGLGDEQRFWKSVRKTESGCWLWAAGRDRDGYGIFRAEIYGVLVFRAHRYSHMLATGEILAADRLVLHGCDNPPCVNPDHLKSGTSLENAADMVSKGRHLDRVRINAEKVTKLSDDQVRSILRDGRPYAHIAEEFAVHPQTVMAIKARTTRGNVEIDPAEVVRNKRGARGAAKSSKLTDDDVRAIRISEERTSVLARQYEVSAPTICDIRKLRSWTHIPAPIFVVPPHVATDGDLSLRMALVRPARGGGCAVDGCGRPPHASGLCHKHYMRVRRTGDAGVAERRVGGPRGAEHHKTTLTEDDIRSIRTSEDKGVVIAKKHGISQAAVSSIRKRKTWTHIT